jgi:diguanylate cyclase (GGDEF)-like protein/PAS domain S-box-containing protein
MSGKRILVVEDQGIIAMDLRHRLVSLGYEVPATLPSGEEAIERCAELRPDLILMDIRLGGALDGIQTAELIRAEHDIPLIYLTAHSDDQTLSRARQTEPHGYLLKPFEDRELLLTIEIALYKHGMEAKLKQSERWLSAILSGIGDAVIATDAQGQVQFVNPVAAALIGGQTGTMTGKPISAVLNLVDAQTRLPLANPIEQTLAQQCPTRLPARALLIARDGRETPVDDSTSLLHNDRGQISGAVLVFRDITEQLMADEQLRYLAYNDALTGLPNRVLFQILVSQALAQATRTGQRGAVLLLDLDRFKAVNDSLGHDVGDQLLKAVGGRLTQVLRQADSVARLGGDEFAILLPEIEHPQNVERVAQKILAAMTEPFALSGYEHVVGASIGIGLFPTDGQDLSTLLKNADAAMYQAKERGRGGFAFYRSEMNAGAPSRLALENDLRHALQRGEFVLHYQPKVTLPQRCLSGVEALVRWQHPQRGLLPPGAFLPLAEETGLILPLSDWVLVAACRQVQAWRREPGLADLRVAVNLADRQFRYPGLVQRVAEVLAATGLPAEALELELTETIIMRDREHAFETLRALKRLGVFLSIDDFGTGYSSLEYVKLLDVDGLKIDRAFVRGAPTDKEDAAIIQAIVTMAHSLDLRVTAEGVETAEQHAHMVMAACDESQGYFFGHPMPADVLIHQFNQGAKAPDASVRVLAS